MDRITNVAKPKLTFSSETDLEIDIEYDDNLTSDTNAKILLNKNLFSVSSTGTPQINDLSLDQFGTMTAGKYAILSESGGYKLEKVELDERERLRLLMTIN